MDEESSSPMKLRPMTLQDFGETLNENIEMSSDSGEVMNGKMMSYQAFEEDKEQCPPAISLSLI